MSLPMATLVCGVDVSMPRTITRRRSTERGRLSRRSQRSIQVCPPGVTTSATRLVIAPAGQLDRDVVGREDLLDRVTPLDQQHRLAVAEVLEPEVHDVLDPLQAVHVDVRDVEPAVILPHQRERRRRDMVRHVESARDPLHERGLAGSELAGEDHGVARPEQLGERLADRSGLVGGPGPELDAHQNSSSCSSPAAGSPAAAVPGSSAGGGCRSAASVRPISRKSSRKSSNCFEPSPPLRRIADGWNVGITVRPCHGKVCPRNLVMPCDVFNTNFVAKLPERADQRRLDDRDLLDEPRCARLDLVRQRVAVRGRTALQHVGDVDVLPAKADLAEHAREQLSGGADERLPLLVLVEPRRLPDEHQVGVWIAHAEHDLRPRLRESTLRARGGVRRGLGERPRHATTSDAAG